MTFGRELPQVDSTWTHGSSGIQPQETREALVDNGKLEYEKRERRISNDQNFELSIAADRKSSLRNTTATALHPPKPAQKNMEKPQPPYLVKQHTWCILVPCNHTKTLGILRTYQNHSKGAISEVSTGTFPQTTSLCLVGLTSQIIQIFGWGGRGWKLPLVLSLASHHMSIFLSKIESNDFVFLQVLKSRQYWPRLPHHPLASLAIWRMQAWHVSIVSPVTSSQKQTCGYSLDSLDSPLFCMFHFLRRASACLVESASPKMHSLPLKPWEAGSGRIWQNTSTVNCMQLITASFASEIDSLEANPQGRDHPAI